jgi:hypothetical protein
LYPAILPEQVGRELTCEGLHWKRFFPGKDLFCDMHGPLMSHDWICAREFGVKTVFTAVRAPYGEEGSSIPYHRSSLVKKLRRMPAPTSTKRRSWRDCSRILNSLMKASLSGLVQVSAGISLDILNSLMRAALSTCICRKK